MTRSDFTLCDFMGQMRQVRKLGPMGKVVGMMPGMRETMALVRMEKGEIEKGVTQMRAIYDSMTPGERDEPLMIGHDRRRRIARGAGVGVKEVVQFLGEFQQTRDMMREIGKTGVVGRMRMRAASDSPSVLGLVTENPRARDPSYVHRPDPYWRRLWMLVGLIAVAIVVAFVCSQFVRRL
jgi:signal recognition particle GTPase